MDNPVHQQALFTTPSVSQTADGYILNHAIIKAGKDHGVQLLMQHHWVRP